MKKLIILSIAAVALMSVMPALAATTVSTSLLADTSGGFNPIVKAKWEMNNAKGSDNKYLGTDDATTAGAQFIPSGAYNGHKTIALCAIVTDPDGLADINNVYTDVFYPENIKLGNSHTALPDQSGDGCGALMQEDKMTVLSKTDGIELFCNKIRTNNHNLPTIDPAYTWDEICAETGELWKDTAAVYCTEKTISYEDPSGDYKVWAVAEDGNGLQDILENHFTYLPLTAFETDFTAISYGNVRLNTHKIISGDKTWGNSIASVRNTGNTRLQMKVQQDDMGFGLTSSVYNVKYDGRVGSDVTFVNYVPYQTKTLNGILDLSELDEMDFSIDVSKFPPTHTDLNYTGTMTLSATSVNHLLCNG